MNNCNLKNSRKALFGGLPVALLLVTACIFCSLKLAYSGTATQVEKQAEPVDSVLLQTFLDAEKAIIQKRTESASTLRQSWGSSPTPEQEKTLSELNTKYNNELRVLYTEFIKNNINNPTGWSQLRKVYSLSLEQMKEAISNVSEESLKNPDVATVVARVQALENTAVGKPFIDIRMSDANGNDIALSDFVGKGKYVMIDFTATWCGPCRVGKPAMIATYNRFKDKGFEIVGVWLDTSHEAWVNGMKALNLPDWPQMSDLKRESEGSKLYGISGIPHSVLIDPNGIIIVRGLSGRELDAKLTELLK